MICLSRSDKNPFKVDEGIKERTNFRRILPEERVGFKVSTSHFHFEDTNKKIKTMLIHTYLNLWKFDSFKTSNLTKI